MPSPSALNISNWRSVLWGYDDYKIVEYLEFRWPIGINRRAALRSHGINHTSARIHPADVKHFIATELGHQALLGPFAGPPATGCHFSPLMTRTKKDSVFRRVIIDLSWPDGWSVNDGISSSDYIDGPWPLNSPHLTTWRGRLSGWEKELSSTKLTCRGGIGSSGWTPWIGLTSLSVTGICTLWTFVLLSGCAATQAIVHLHGRKGYSSRAYIDDFGGTESTEAKASAALGALHVIMATLGVAQAEAKIYLPSQSMVWLGVLFDTLEMSMAIPSGNLREIMECL